MDTSMNDVDFIKGAIKEKLLSKVKDLLDDYAEILGDRGCDDLSTKGFTSEELVLLNMEHHKLNGDVDDAIKGGYFANKLNSESSLVYIIANLAERKIAFGDII